MCQACDELARVTKLDSAWIHAAVSKSAADDPLSDAGALAWEGRIEAMLLKKCAPLVQERLDTLSALVESLSEGEDLEAFGSALTEAIPGIFEGLGSEVVKASKAAQLIADEYVLAVWEARQKESGIVEKKVSSPKAPPAPVKEVAGTLRASRNMWLGERFNDEVVNRAQAITAKWLEKGKTPAEIASKLNRAFGGAIGGEAYWTTVSAAWTTTARTYTSLRSFYDEGIEEYVFRNPGDHRTSEICKGLNGRSWKVAKAYEAMTAMLELDSIDKVKRASPWMNVDSDGEPFVEYPNSRAYLSTMTTDQMGKAGILWPPRHGRCRSHIEAVR